MRHPKLPVTTYCTICGLIKTPAAGASLIPRIPSLIVIRSMLPMHTQQLEAIHPPCNAGAILDTTCFDSIGSNEEEAATAATANCCRSRCWAFALAICLAIARAVRCNSAFAFCPSTTALECLCLSMTCRDMLIMYACTKHLSWLSSTACTCEKVLSSSKSQDFSHMCTRWRRAKKDVSCRHT